MLDESPVIAVSDVTFGYERSRAVVERISAGLMPGRLTAVVGPNAAGKTTLLRLMLGLLRPWSGQVEVGRVPVHRMSPRDRARWLSYVPQRPGVRFGFTVRQVVAMGAHTTPGETRDVIDRVIEQAGLTEIADRVFQQLSGGQQQRVLLARAQVQSADSGRAMLLDEPGSHLDLHHRHATMRRLRDLTGQGLAVLVVLHDLDLAARYADDAWLVDQGRLVAAGRWDEVLTPARLEPVYGLPLTQIDSNTDRPLLVVSTGSGDTMQQSQE